MNAELQEKVKEAIVLWTGNRSHGDSQESPQDDSLVDMLMKLEPPKKTDEDRSPPNKKTKLSPAAGKKPNFKSRTFKDAALLVVDHCQEGDLKCLEVNLKEGVVLDDFKEREGSKAKIMQLDNDKIRSVIFKNHFFNEHMDLNESYIQLERMFCPQTNIKEALKELFQLNQAEKDGGSILDWERDLVEATKDKFYFPADLTKGQAVVISGESGSGKSWFAKKFLPKQLDGASFIYHELGDTDPKSKDKATPGAFRPRDEVLGFAYQRAMKDLFTKGWRSTLVYEAVSELSRKNNKERNAAALDKFERLMMEAVRKNPTVEAWWHTPSHKLEELVIILDEAGKEPELARGLVDEVRQINVDICNKGLAEKVLLVLVGAGLDHYTEIDSLDFDADPTERDLYARFGTDPTKSELTTVTGPKLEGRHKISDIPVRDIMRGKYSRVLATNTRMLTRGVIPILRSPMNTLRVDNPSERRVELGSTNIVMDYAARVYIHLNGLSRLHDNSKEESEAFLLSQFRLLVFGVLRSLKDAGNPAFQCPFALNWSEYESVLRAGLITTDIVSTSSALRYIGCKGQTAPLDAQDGVAFEIVIQYHLIRLCKAQYNADRGTDKPNPKYYCGRYDLAQAWPPSSTKKDGLKTEKEVSEEIDSRYGIEQDKSRPKKDAKEIAELLKQKGCDEYDLVLRQTVNNVQGADVLVLSKRLVNGDTGQKEANLDLYQAKHYNKIPSLNSNETTGAFSSLGVDFDAKDDLFETEPKAGSAGYSYKGTQKFVVELSRALDVSVRVRKRVVVFSQGWNSFSKSTSWTKFNFATGESKNVWIWTREMLEPTISALVTRSAMEIADGASD